MARRRRSAIALAGITTTILFTGCLAGEDDEGAGETEDGDGSVEIIGAIPEEEAVGLVKELEAFTEDTGIEVSYTASTDFTTEIRTRVSGGDPPDIALFPQPGLVTDLVDTGDALPLNDLIDTDDLEGHIVPGFLDSVTVDDEVYAVPVRMAAKSLVWYPVPEFEEAGYQVPETWADLEALQEQMRSDGETPWCLGAESGADTGWVYTDWVEEIMLRTAGPDVYDDWTSHEIPFDDDAVVEAVEQFGEIVHTEGNVRGGPDGSLNTPFGESVLPLVEDPPGCFMHRQANFITTFMPEDVQADLPANVGVFVLPGDVEGGFEGTPVLGGGDLAAALVNDSDVVEVMEFLASSDFGAEWAAEGGWLSPSVEFDTSNYATEIDQQIAELVSQADVFRFDGSDLMPAAVGAGTFWDEMVAFVGGEQDAGDAATAIEESWRD
ncbi:ABC transporter substrate-binding protein [Nocardioides bizhenqiangii]|uniref:ABC transporter substrate-binding protein n=1 Tax=Nocardioides bizhenqiangii TaxID=3095076 RepID=A0ABZ0ZN95_9ACTN|nr:MULTISPECIES: ABC transporter substrate-binding protein [unclassified Nocardioides]MDZ5621363.1 ABC transporter substrate-binding protein [Nocardioides sp. HM23]WQQ25797.1 ABC transporter substrate-binding protein [Nocardioides sp. HM61]